MTLTQGHHAIHKQMTPLVTAARTTIAMRAIATAMLIATATTVPSVALANTYYVDGTNGNDNNSGASASQAVRTIAKGSTMLKAGDTLLIRGGTYSARMWHGKDGFVFRNGTATNYTRYSGYPGEVVVIKPPAYTCPTSDPNCRAFVMWFNTAAAYIEVSDLVLDGTNTTHYNIKLDMSDTAAAHHIRVARNNIRYGLMGIQNGGQSCEIVGNEIHGMAKYGIYGGKSLDGSGGLFEGNIIHDNAGHGIHLYDSYGGVTNNVIRNNVFYRNGSGYWGDWGYGRVFRRFSALLLSSGPKNRAYNNVIYDNYAGLEVKTSSSYVYNNTVYGNQTDGIAVQGGANSEVINNLSWGNGNSQIADHGTQTTLKTNLTFDPKVVNAAAGDFHLRPDSAAINAGTTLTEVKLDRDGVARPSRSAYDIGAYEFKSATVQRPSSPMRLQVQ